MRSGILINNRALSDFTLVCLKNKMIGYADVSCSPYDAFVELTNYGLMANEINLSILSNIFLYDELYLVAPSSLIDYSGLSNYIQLNLIEKLHIYDIDDNYSEYVKPIIMNSLYNDMQIGKNQKIFMLLTKLYDEYMKTGYYSIDKRNEIVDLFEPSFVNEMKTYKYYESVLNQFDDPKVAWQVFLDLFNDKLIDYVSDFVINSENSALKDLVILDSNIKFNGFIEESKAVESYNILRIAADDIMGATPVFGNLYEMFKFKERNRTAINTLKNEIDCLENELRNHGEKAALLKAINDIKKANESLIKNSLASKISKATFILSLPAAIASYLLKMDELLTLSIGSVGAISTLLNKKITNKNNWVEIIR